MPFYHVGSQYSTVTSSSQKFTNACDPLAVYILSSSVDCWFSVGATGGSASAGAGSHFLAAGVRAEISVPDATNGFVHIIREGSSDGKASLTLISGAS